MPVKQHARCPGPGEATLRTVQSTAISSVATFAPKMLRMLSTVEALTVVRTLAVGSPCLGEGGRKQHRGASTHHPSASLPSERAPRSMTKIKPSKIKLKPHVLLERECHPCVVDCVPRDHVVDLVKFLRWAAQHISPGRDVIEEVLHGDGGALVALARGHTEQREDQRRTWNCSQHVGRGGTAPRLRAAILHRVFQRRHRAGQNSACGKHRHLMGATL